MADGILDLTSKGLTFMLSFSTEEAQQSLSSLTPNIDDLIRAAKQAQSASKEAADSTTQWAQQISTSWSQINDQVSQGSGVYQLVDNKLSRIGSTASELGDKIANFLSKARQDTFSTENEIFKLVSGLKDLGNEGEKAGGRLSWVKDLFAGFTASASSNLRDIIGSLKSAGEGGHGGSRGGDGGGGDSSEEMAALQSAGMLSKKFGALQIAGIAAEVLGFKELVIDSAAAVDKFSSSIEVFITRLGGSQESFSKWRTAVLDLAVKLQRSPEEITQSMQAFLNAAKDIKLVEAPDLAKPYLESIVKLSEVLGTGKNVVSNWFGELRRINSTTAEQASELANVIASSIKKGFNPAEVTQLVDNNLSQISEWSKRLSQTLQENNNLTKEQIGVVTSKNMSSIMATMIEAQQMLKEAGGNPEDINQIFSNIFNPMSQEFLKAIAIMTQNTEAGVDGIKEKMTDFLKTGNIIPVLTEFWKSAQNIPADAIAVMSSSIDSAGGGISDSLSKFFVTMRKISQESITSLGQAVSSSLSDTKALDTQFNSLNETLATVNKRSASLFETFGKQVAVRMTPFFEEISRGSLKIAEFLSTSDLARDSVIALGSAMVALPIAAMLGAIGSSVGGGIIGAFSSLPTLLRTVASGFSGLGLAMTGLIAINAHEWLIKNNESYKNLVGIVSEALSGTVNYSNVLEDLSGIYRKLSDSVDSLREKLMISITGTGIETFLNGLKKDLKELDFLEKLSSILTDINNTLDAISNRDISQAASNIGHLLGLGQKPSVGDENSTSSGSGSSVTEPPNSSSEWAIKNRSMLDDIWTFIQRRAGGSGQSSPSENENLGQSPRAFIESTQKNDMSSATSSSSDLSIELINEVRLVKEALTSSLTRALTLDSTSIENLSRSIADIIPKSTSVNYERSNDLASPLVTYGRSSDLDSLKEEIQNLSPSISNISSSIADLIPKSTSVNYERSNDLASLKEEIRNLSSSISNISSSIVQGATSTSTSSTSNTKNNFDSSKETDRIVSAINESAASIVGSVKELASSRFMSHRSRSDSNYH